MATNLYSYFETEYQTFLSISKSARALLLSVFISNLASPLLNLFSSSFLIRTGNDFKLVALFNIAIYIALAVSYRLNNRLSRFTSVSRLYQIGVLGQAIVVVAFFFSAPSTVVDVLLFGFLHGIPAGLFWANRKLIAMDTTADSQRFYFTGLEQILGVVGGIITPLLVGWYVGDLHTGNSSIGSRYQTLSLVAFLLLALSAWYATKIRQKIPLESYYHPPFTSYRWQQVRTIQFLEGFRNGVTGFLIPLFVFAYIGTEKELGSISSLAALFSCAILYVLIRKLQSKSRMKVLALTYVAFILLTTYHFFAGSVASALALVLLIDPIFNLNWSAFNPLLLHQIEIEDQGVKRHNYAYITDLQTFLNIGRVVSTILFLLCLYWLSQSLVLRVFPFLLALSQLAIIYFFKRIKGSHAS